MPFVIFNTDLIMTYARVGHEDTNVTFCVKCMKMHGRLRAALIGREPAGEAAGLTFSREAESEDREARRDA